MLESRLAKIDRTIGIFKRIRDEELQEYLNAADFMVLPYRNILTSGTVYLAQSFSLPVIAPRLGLIAEAVTDKVSGIIYDPSAGDGLSEALRAAVSMEKSGLEKMKSGTLRSAEQQTWVEAQERLLKASYCGVLGVYRQINMPDGRGVHAYIRFSSVWEGSRPEVGVVILHYHNLQDTIRCVHSVTDQQKADFDLYLVTNDEDPEAFIRLCSLYPEATVIQAMSNGGYAKGNNLGLALILEKSTPYFLILNPDTEIEPGVVDVLLDRAPRFPETGMFGVTILFGNQDDKVWFCGGNVSWDNGLETTHGFLGASRSDLPKKPFQCDYITGAFLFGRTEIVRKIGLLPEEYFLYFEETDWCLSARDKGYELTVFPDLIIRHYKRSEEDGLPTDTYLKYFCRSAIRLCHKKNPSYINETKTVLRGKADAWLDMIGKKRPDRLPVVRKIIEEQLGEGQ